MFPLIILICALSVWSQESQPLVGGDAPTSRIADSLSAPKKIKRFNQSTIKNTSTPQMDDRWSTFLGSFRISLDQAPLESFQQVSTGFRDIDTTLHHRPSYIAYITPLEPFRVTKPKAGEDASNLWEIYSLYLGIGIGKEYTFAIEHQAVIPTFRSGNSQLSCGAYLSTYFFRDGNPYWSSGLMGWAGYLVTSNLMIRVGLKHPLFDYLKREDRASEDSDQSNEYTVKPNNWRMSVSLSIGSI